MKLRPYTVKCYGVDTLWDNMWDHRSPYNEIHNMELCKRGILWHHAYSVGICESSTIWNHTSWRCETVGSCETMYYEAGCKCSVAIRFLCFYDLSVCEMHIRLTSKALKTQTEETSGESGSTTTLWTNLVSPLGATTTIVCVLWRTFGNIYTQFQRNTGVLHYRPERLLGGGTEI